MDELINNLIKNKKIVEIYTNCEETDKFCLGIICSSDDDFILVKCFDEYGKYDGYLVIQKCKIYRLSYDSQYIKKMLYFISENDDEVINNCSNNILFALNSEKLLSIRLMDSGFDDVYGYVETVDSDNVSLICINEYGLYDGKTKIDINCISSVEFDSKKTKFISELFNKNGNYGTIINCQC